MSGLKSEQKSKANRGSEVWTWERIQSFVLSFWTSGSNQLLQRLKRWRGGGRRGDLCNSINVFWKGQEGIIKVAIARTGSRDPLRRICRIPSGRQNIVHTERRLLILKTPASSLTRLYNSWKMLTAGANPFFIDCWKETDEPAAPLGCHGNHLSDRPGAAYCMLHYTKNRLLLCRELRLFYSIFVRRDVRNNEANLPPLIISHNPLLSQH